LFNIHRKILWFFKVTKIRKNYTKKIDYDVNKAKEVEGRWARSFARPALNESVWIVRFVD